jgi:hypothetical protein
LEVATSRKPLEAIEEHFSKVNDPPVDRTIVHKLIDLIAIAICAVICGAEGWVDIELFGKSKLPWLKTFLELPMRSKTPTRTLSVPKSMPKTYGPLILPLAITFS